jgi:hypothetical protein
MSKLKKTFNEPLPERNFQALKTHALAKRGIGALVTFAAADFAAQLWARYRRMLIVDAKHDFTGPSAQGHGTKRGLRADWDYWQLVRTALFGGFFFAPLRMRWHQSLDNVFPITDTQTPSMHRATLAKRFLSDHCLFVPAVIAMYFAFHSLMEMRPLSETPKRVVAGLPSALLCSWCIWVPIQGLCWVALPVYTWNAMTVLGNLLWVGYMADLNRQMRRTAGSRLQPTAAT